MLNTKRVKGMMPDVCIWYENYNNHHMCVHGPFSENLSTSFHEDREYISWVTTFPINEVMGKINGSLNSNRKLTIHITANLQSFTKQL